MKSSPNTAAPLRESYQVREIPAVTGFTKTQAWELVWSGQLESFKVGRRRFVRADTLRKFLKRCEADARPRGRTEESDQTSEQG